MNDSDLQLLENYAQRNSQDSFAALVNRHLNLVFSTALRQVHSPQLAEEVSQSVFADLAQSAAKLKPNTILTAWLYEVTRRTAIDVVRRESRRQLREKVAHELTAMNATAADWTEIEPFLDEAMHALDATDRTAVLLRYFENKSLREVGDALGTSDDTAQKRVSRAVERLREFFTKRGVTVGASGLVFVMSANAVQAAPAGLAVSISSAITIAGTALAATTTKIIVMTTLQKTLITTTLVAAVGTGIYQARQVSNLRSQMRAFQQEQTEKIRQLERERDEASTQLAALRDENEHLKGSTAELVKLRGEVSQLRAGGRNSANLDSPNRPVVGSPVPPNGQADDNELSRDSWADAGFTTPQAALRTRGWAVLNGNRERFKESVHVTDAARKILEDMFVRMAEASNDPNKTQYIQDILDHNYEVEDAILMPLMALNRDKSFTGYRILSQQSPAENEMIVQIETGMATAPAQKETLKFQNFDGHWKVVIDEDFIKAHR